MPFTEAKANIKGDLFDVYVDGAKGPFQATFDWTITEDVKPVVTGRTGTTPIAHMLHGKQVSLDVTWQQMTLAEMETIFSTGSAAPRNLVTTSDAPTAFEIELRPAGEIDDANAIVLFEMIVAENRYSNDGQGERQLITRFVGQLDQTTNLLGRIGSIA